jgi:Sec-independent protein translocase protein TatA
MKLVILTTRVILAAFIIFGQAKLPRKWSSVGAERRLFKKIS